MVDSRQEYEDLFAIYWPIGLGVLVVVWILIVAFAWRYRAGRERRVTERHKSPPVESLYVAVLAFVAAALVLFTFTTLSESEANLPGDSGSGFDESQAEDGADTPSAVTEVRVTGARWNWRFDYPEYGATVAGTGTDIPTLVVPVGNVRFVGTSVDVIHGFFIPELRFKREVFPERRTAFTLGFEEPALWRSGACTQYCGLRHAYMRFDVRILPREAFDAWARRQARKGDA